MPTCRSGRSPRSRTSWPTTGVAGDAGGVDFAEIATLFELQRQGVEVRDGQQVMLDARQIKSADEITLLSTAAAMVDGVYQDITDALKPGVRENEIVALANKRLYEMGSDDVESINAVSGERCNPHPHNFSDRHDPPRRAGVLRHHALLQRLPDLLLPDVQRRQLQPGAAGRLRPGQRLDGGRAGAIKPGVSTDQVARLWPTAQDIGLADEKTAFGLQFGHGLGLALHERPIISRLSSLDAPMEIQKGMVFALETYCPADRRGVRRPARGRGGGDRRRRGDHHQVPLRGTVRHQPLLRPASRPWTRQPRLTCTGR